MRPVRLLQTCIPVTAIAMITLICSLRGTSHATVTIQPNSIEHNIGAEKCFQNQEPGVCIPCATDCIKGDNRVGAAIRQCIIGAPVGTRQAASSIATDIKIAATAGNAGELVPAMVVYDVWWQGNVAVWGGPGGDLRNQTYVALTLTVTDQVSGQIIYQEDIHRLEVEKESYIRDLVLFGAYHDEGGASSSFTVILRTGREYRIQLKLKCFSRLDWLPIPPIYYCLDYEGGQRGAGWDVLKVFAGQDASSIVAEANSRIDSLKEQVEHHTHPYLTGRGVGHNNIEVETGKAIFLDDDEPSPSSLKGQPGDKDFPTPSVIKAGVPITKERTDVDASGATDLIDVTKVINESFRENRAAEKSTAATTSIVFSLPESETVVMRLHDTTGRVVKTLLDQSMNAGSQEVELETTGLATGVYYYSLRAGSYYETRKLVLNR